MLFRTVILPPLKRPDRLALRRQLRDRFLHVFHLLRRRALLVFEKQRMLQFAILATLFWRSPIINDKHLVQMRPKDLAERLMIWMRQVLRPTSLIVECN